MKTELLVQMDGLAKTDDLVFLLAASNLPWYILYYIFRLWNSCLLYPPALANVISKSILAYLGTHPIISTPFSSVQLSKGG